ncbi:sterol desaturase family protein [Rossellomorea aquimaris]|uniref:sterol desaturase family protein n=1 Tax=Rossellomorea aquimaris TaxID=189382 RepID=UPI0007D05BD4|nr:sterol desaturase family protein [Rossellomorea aquimaris]
MKKVYRDFFFFPDVLIMFFVLFSICGVLIWQRVTFITVITFIMGLIFFSFSEYLTHRFLFHLKPPKNQMMLNFLKRIHYDHHKDPHDLHLLFLPIWYSLPNFIILCSLFYVIFQNAEYALAFGGGLISMLLMYEWKHYVAHRPIKPRTKFGRWVKKVHVLHHFKNENYWYGVSTPFVDVLFGTLKNEKEVETSKTVKELEKRGS